MAGSPISDRAVGAARRKVVRGEAGYENAPLLS
jgi:hypothetical protein